MCKLINVFSWHALIRLRSFSSRSFAFAAARGVGVVCVTPFPATAGEHETRVKEFTQLALLASPSVLGGDRDNGRACYSPFSQRGGGLFFVDPPRFFIELFGHVQ